MFLRNISIRRKLILAFGIVLLLAASVGAVAWLINSYIQVDIAQIQSAAIKKYKGSSLMTESLLSLRVSRRDLLMGRYRDTDPLAHVLAPQDELKVSQTAAETIDQFESALALCRSGGHESQELAKHQGFLNEIDEENTQLQMLDTIEVKFSAFRSNFEKFSDPHSDLAVLTEMIRHPADYLELLSLVKNYEGKVQQQIDYEVSNIGNSVQRTNTILLCSTLLILVLSGFVIWFIDRLISRPIEALTTSAQRIGKGDFGATVSIRSDDELGILARTFNQMTHDLKSTTVSRDYVDRILKSMANSLIVLHSDRTIESFNHATLQLLGYSSDELVGLPMDSILKSPLTRQTSILADVAAQGAISEAEAHYQSKDGQLIPITVSASLLSSMADVSSGIVCVAQDISARKKSEEDLAKANRELLESSRQAGMAEVATSVLHNVGNVLNSVNVSSALISEKVQKSKISNLTRAVALIEEHQTDLSTFLSLDPNGKRLPGYLSKLTVNLVHEQKEILDEASSLAANVLHIREIVAMQQNYARVSGTTEMLSAKDLMEDAVRINIGSLERHQVKLVREYADLPPVAMQKHKVLQILVNLIRNAKHACDDAGRPDKEITLRLNLEKDRVKMSVRDNGVGIPVENLSRIFAHGFTTRKEGHGFGLHSGALMAKEMGGTLSAFSDGPNQGATFVIELPTTPNSP